LTLDAALVFVELSVHSHSHC